jgi:hypothetical protein
MRARRCNHALAACAIALAACAGQVDDAGDDRAHDAPVGQLGLSLRIGSFELSDVQFTISRDDGFMQQGAIPLRSDDGSFDATIVLPAATGYRIVLEASTDDGLLCNGSSDFDVAVGQHTAVRLLVHCHANALGK